MVTLIQHQKKPMKVVHFKSDFLLHRLMLLMACYSALRWITNLRALILMVHLRGYVMLVQSRLPQMMVTNLPLLMAR